MAETFATSGQDKMTARRKAAETQIDLKPLKQESKPQKQAFNSQISERKIDERGLEYG